MIKGFILIFTLFSLNTYGVLAQKSPIKFLNNTLTIHVDTTNVKYERNDLIDLKYKFVNVGEHVAFIDSVRFPVCITKPKDTSTLVLQCHNFSSELYSGRRLKKDTSYYINIPFYYEGKIYYEKIICKYTFGKSKLIEYDKSLMLVDDIVSKFFVAGKNDTIIRIANINFTVYVSVKNITNGPIWCTRNKVGYDDGIVDHGNYTDQSFVMIPPNTTYKMPVVMNMSGRYRFSKLGTYLVFSEGVFEVHQFMIKSDFEPKGKYIH